MKKHASLPTTVKRPYSAFTIFMQVRLAGGQLPRAAIIEPRGRLPGGRPRRAARLSARWPALERVRAGGAESGYLQMPRRLVLRPGAVERVRLLVFLDRRPGSRRLGWRRLGAQGIWRVAEMVAGASAFRLGFGDVFGQAAQISRVLSESLAATALGEAAGLDENVIENPDLLPALSRLLFEDLSWSVKVASARALGMVGGEGALRELVRYMEEGPLRPRRSSHCDAEYWLAFYADCTAFDRAKDAVELQAVRAAIRIAGQNYNIGNPGTLEQARRECVERLQEYLESLPGNGGRP